MKKSALPGLFYGPGFFVIFLMLLLLLFSPAEGAVIRVTETGSGTRDGSSWENACGEAEFITRLAEADSGDEFWVAKGYYRPSTTGNTGSSFLLKNGVALYGGFSGRETERSQRIPSCFETLLTGQLDGNRPPYSGNWPNGSNSRHVIIGSGTDSTALMDGFTVCRGYNLAQGQGSGAGLYNNGGSPTVVNCIFRDHYAERGRGAAVANINGSKPSIKNCTFEDCLADWGTALFNSESSPLLDGCTFSNNFASSQGGAVHNEKCSSIFINCTFSRNRAKYGASAIYNFYSSASMIINCTFSGNYVTVNNYFGTIVNILQSSLLIVNSILWDGQGGEIVNDNESSASIIRSIVKDNDVGIGTGVDAVISNDPNLSPLDDNGGPAWTCAIPSNSPAVNYGLPVGTAVSGDIGVPAKDQRGVSRPHAAAPGQQAAVDIGAFEFALAPEVPVHSSPANGTDQLPLTPPLLQTTGEYFHPAGTAYSRTLWQLFIHTYFSEKTSIDGAFTTDRGEWTPSVTLSYNKKYSWRVRYQDIEGVWSPWSEPWTFSTEPAPLPPNAPVLSAPVNGAVDIRLLPFLSTDPYFHPEGRTHELTQWQIGTANTFEPGNFVENVSSDDLTEWNLPAPLDYGTIYYWRTRVKDATDLWSPWSAVWNFTSVPTPPPYMRPDTPALSYPADGGTDIPILPVLTSGPYSHPSMIDQAQTCWQLSVEQNFSPVSTTEYISGSSLIVWALTNSLGHSTSYWWRTRYQDEWGGWSEWSPAWSFSTVAPPVGPDAPILSTPPDRSDSMELTPTLSTEVYSHPLYLNHQRTEWQIGPDPAFSPRSAGGEVTSVDLTDWTFPERSLDYDSTYYWRVRFQDEMDTWSDWSPAWSFTTLSTPEEPEPPVAPEEQVPDAPILLSPKDGNIDVSLSSTLEIAPYSHPAGTAYGATCWQICINTSFTPATFETVTRSSASALTLSEASIDAGIQYFWRVSFQDVLGRWSKWSPVWNFSTSKTASTTTPNQPSEPTPESSGGGCNIAWGAEIILLLLPLLLMLGRRK